MSKLQVQSIIDTDSVLKSAADLKISDLEVFARQLDAVILRKKTNDKKFREKQLIQLINQTALPVAQLQEYHSLSQKIEDETITESERTTFLALVETEEQLRNDRLKYLIELANLREITLTALMKNLGLSA